MIVLLHARASSTGKLSDPKLGPEIHAVLTRINGNIKTFKPGWHAILERYKKKYHKAYREETQDIRHGGDGWCC